MPKIKVRDIEMYYEIRGEGRPLLMIMGFQGNMDCWDPYYMIPNLADHYKLILFDNRGAGRTELGNPEEFTIRLMADDAAALLDALGIEHAHVLGISMGGMIAQELAANHPERVDKLILLSTYCGGDESFLGPASANVIRISNLLVERGAWDREMAGMLIPNLLSDEYIEQNPDDVEEWIDRLLIAPTKLEASIQQVSAILSLDVCGQLPGIKVPTLIVAGKKDTYIPAENAKVMAKRMLNSKLIYSEKSAHMLQEEMEQTSGAIVRFLSG